MDIPTVMTAACASETRTFCAREADLLALLASVTSSDDVRVRERQDRVRDCLVDHADELSPSCVAALVGNVATQHSALPTTSAEMDTNTTTEATPADATAEPTEKASTETEPAETRPSKPQPVIMTVAPHHESAAATAAPVPVQAPLSVVQPQYVQTTTDNGDAGIEVRIFLINHPGQAMVGAPPPATPNYIRIGGDTQQDKPTSHAVAAGMAMSPWLWVMILPFMVIGMYVSAVQTIAFVRRRRDVVYRVGAAQYMPIPTSLNPSKPLRHSVSSTV